MQYNYTPVSDTSFRLTDGGAVYALPKFFKLWQIRHVTKLLSELTKTCSKSGSMLATVLLAAFNDAPGTGDEKMAATIQKIERSTGGELGPQAIEGVGDILDFLSADLRLSTLMAVLFTPAGEGELPDDELTKRARLFEEHADPKILLTGIKSFFFTKTSAKTSSDSHSKILEAPKRKNTNRTSAGSTGTSTVSNV